MKILFLSLSLIALLVSCKDQYQTCPSQSLSVFAYGYDSSAIDTVLVSQYKKGSNFTQKIADSFLGQTKIPVNQSHDSFYLTSPRWNLYATQFENYDWRFTVLSDGNHVDVANAIRKFNRTSVNHPTAGCSSPIVSAVVNGQFIQDEGGIQFIYLIKP